VNKKKQKNFHSFARGQARPKRMKVFWFFFSKKNMLSF